MTDFFWVIIFTSIVLMLLSTAYIAMLAVSNRRIINEQQSKLIEIQKSEERYKALFNNTIVGMVSFSRQGWKVLDVNQSLLEKLEMASPKEFQHRFHEMIAPREKDIVISLQRDHCFQDCEISVKTISGKELTLLFSGREDASDHYIHSVLIDITEKRRLEESYMRAQKMEALSILTNSIAHDLQNVFAPMQLSLKLLEKQVKSKRGEKIFKATKNSLRDGQQLVSNIFAIAKGIKKDHKQIHLNALIRSILHSFHPARGIAVAARNAVQKENVTILGNENQLKQMFLNILRNSEEAIQKKGMITIDIARNGTGTVGTNGKRSAIETVTIAVSDNGVGIHPDHVHKVFEPFFTTKRNVGGTGLGLSMVSEIIKQHSGTVMLESKEAKGTTLTVSLPILREHGK